MCWYSAALVSESWYGTCHCPGLCSHGRSQAGKP